MTVGATIGRYRLVRELGSGGFGTVWEALDDTSGATVAVKLLDQAGESTAVLRTHLLAEAAALRAVDSPHTLRVLDVVEDGGHLGLVTDIVPGVSLRVVLDEHGPLEGRDALVVLHGAASGLAAVHAAGLVHGDVKPANMLVEPSGTSRLIDFGLASLPGWVSADSVSPWGSPAYAAPEQVAHDYRDHRSDIYSLTVSLFEVVCGRRPFVGGTVEEVRSRHLHQTLPDPRSLVPDLGDGLTQLILWGLAKDPDRRPPDVVTWLQYLEAAATTKYGDGWAAPATVGGVIGGMLAGGVVASGVLALPGAVTAGALTAGGATATTVGGAAGVGAVAGGTTASGVSAGGASVANVGGATFWSTFAGKAALGVAATTVAVGGGFAVKAVVDQDPSPPPAAARPSASPSATPPVAAATVEKVVLTVWDDDGDTSVALAEPDGSHQTVLAAGSDGTLSPDGAEVAFVTPDGDIATVPTAGGAWHTVVTTTDSEFVYRPVWSTDSESILYGFSGLATAHSVMQVSADATMPAEDGAVIIDGGPGLSTPTVGPAGRAAYADVIDRATGSSTLFVVDAPGAAPQQVDGTGSATDPAWSPTGDVIAYVSTTFDPDDGLSSTVRLIAPDGSADRAAATDDFGEGMPRLVWSPDGEEIAVSSGNGWPRTTSLLTPATGELRAAFDAEITDWQEIPVGVAGPGASPTDAGASATALRDPPSRSGTWRAGRGGNGVEVCAMLTVRVGGWVPRQERGACV